MAGGINYCVRCGSPMEDRFIYGRVRRVCVACGHVHFDDPKVAAVTFIRDHDKVLLVKRSVEPERGKWALPGGYVDAGEAPNAAAIREALEETGLEIEIVRLLDVFFTPNGNRIAPIIIIYEGRMIGGQLQANDDVDEAAWYTADNLPAIAFESTQQVIERWVNNAWG